MIYRREIDGLRALAISLSFIHAGFQAFSGGYVGGNRPLEAKA